MRSPATYRLRPPSPTTNQIRALNDTLRRHNLGGRTLLTTWKRWPSAPRSTRRGTKGRMC